MLPSVRFFIISIVSIFAALGIGIFIGFTLNTQDFIIEQNQIISGMVETQLEILMDENKELKSKVDNLNKENNFKDEFIETSYNYLLENRLKDLKIGIIETNEDYITSGIGKDLEFAGATILNVTSINNNITDKEQLNKLYKTINYIPKNPVETSINELIQSIITGKSNSTFDLLKKEDLIRTLGRYDESVDYIVICGGSIKDPAKRIGQVDRNIISLVKKYNIPIIGVEKSNVEYSYISNYKDFGITTIDCVDLIIGKIAMVLAMEGASGSYGIKNTAERVIPSKIGLIE